MTTVGIRRVLTAGIASGLAFATLAGAAARAEAPSAPAPPANDSAQEWHARRGLYYVRNWGVDIAGVKPIAAGFMLEFRYRIVDPETARILNEKKAKAYLIDQKSGTALAVPTLENVGELRQTSTPKAGRSYYILFGNPGKLVKPGDRVTIVVGEFRADDLIVD